VSSVGSTPGIGTHLQVGVVRTPARDLSRGKVAMSDDAYLVCAGGRMSWSDGDVERVQRVAGSGTLLAVIDGEGEAEGSGRAVSNAVARVLSKLYAPSVPRDPLAALSSYLIEAHTRMYWKARSGEGGRMGASLAGCWVHETELCWVTLGTAQAWLYREGVTTRLGRPWPVADQQRLVRGSRGMGDDTSVHFQDGVNRGRLPLQAGDRVVLATDGLCRVVDDASLGQLLLHVQDPQAAAVACMERALARGAEDHVTVVVAELQGVPASAEEVRAASLAAVRSVSLHDGRTNPPAAVTASDETSSATERRLGGQRTQPDQGPGLPPSRRRRGLLGAPGSRREDTVP
jgi:serine/threonine protein phosphatase PrpC